MAQNCDTRNSKRRKKMKESKKMRQIVIDPDVTLQMKTHLINQEFKTLKHVPMRQFTEEAILEKLAREK